MRREQDRLKNNVRVKFTDEAMEELREFAYQNDMTLSGFIRGVTLWGAERYSTQLLREEMEHSGLTENLH